MFKHGLLNSNWAVAKFALRRALTTSASAASPRGSPLCHPVVG